MIIIMILKMMINDMIMIIIMMMIIIIIIRIVIMIMIIIMMIIKMITIIIKIVIIITLKVPVTEFCMYLILIALKKKPTSLKKNPLLGLHYLPLMTLDVFACYSPDCDCTSFVNICTYIQTLAINQIARIVSTL